MRRLLGGDELAWLVNRVRRRLERGEPVTGSTTLAEASLEQRRAVERLLGRRGRTGGSLTVSLDEVDAVLRGSGAAPDGLAGAVRVLVGVVVNQSERSAAEAREWVLAQAPLDELIERRPELRDWREWLDSTGLLRRCAADAIAAHELCAGLARVVDRLPAKDVALGRLAADATGKAHALDDGRPLATLAISAARALAGSAPAGSGSALERRAAWAAVGVHRDELSSTVLALGLPGGTDSAMGQILALARTASEPVVLTLRQLTRIEPAVLGVRSALVRICENPIVVASAADRLGSVCPPLICLSGQPSAAARHLLEMLSEAGADFAYHGDFDWGGVRIANSLTRHIPWRPWRFTTADYLNALPRATGGTLSGRPAAAVWDTELAPTLRRHGVRIEEELVLDELVEDLATRAGHGRADAASSGSPLALRTVSPRNSDILNS
ncbi:MULTISPECIES: TIGR02679 family protein [unclassified Nocardia]|uniref:TIGR02679 family protein n=1 Tax=unclassified Nocardia TaxID=2637762 RepID=UPI001CE480C9|nr:MULTISPECIES: TIGR02679 family protein [unclassified Nocardia]